MTSPTKTPRTRRSGYRGEPSKTAYAALLPGQRLCLFRIAPGRYCVEPRRHRGDHK